MLFSAPDASLEPSVLWIKHSSRFPTFMWCFFPTVSARRTHQEGLSTEDGETCLAESNLPFALSTEWLFSLPNPLKYGGNKSSRKTSEGEQRELGKSRQEDDHLLDWGQQTIDHRPDLASPLLFARTQLYSFIDALSTAAFCPQQQSSYERDLQYLLCGSFYRKSLPTPALSVERRKVGWRGFWWARCLSFLTFRCSWESQLEVAGAQNTMASKNLQVRKIQLSTGVKI